MGNDCPSREELLRFAEEALDAAEARSVEEHVASCDECRAELESLARVTGLLHSARSLARLSEDKACARSAELAAYADGSLSEEEASAFEGHLAGCAACLEELADLWALEGPSTRDVRDSVIERTLARLSREGRTAVLRFRDRAVELVAGFADSLADASAPEPALAAVSRATPERVALRWRDETGLEVEAVVEPEGDRVLLTGRMDLPAGSASAVSASLSSEDGHSVGPESLDKAGRFGPWRLCTGSNTLRFTGSPLAGERGLELTIEIV
jgi:anti-sigma factor RsiW